MSVIVAHLKANRRRALIVWAVINSLFVLGGWLLHYAEFTWTAYTIWGYAAINAPVGFWGFWKKYQRILDSPFLYLMELEYLTTGMVGGFKL